MPLLLKHTLLMCTAVALLCCNSPQKPVTTPGNAVLLAADTVMAGEPLEINLQVQNIPAGETVYIMCQGSWGSRIIEYVTGRTSDIVFTDSLTGLLTIQALFRNHLLAEKKVQVVPHPAAEPLDTYLGSKSVIANGRDWAMVTAIPTDQFGNLVEENTMVDFDMLRPDKRREQYSAPTHCGVAYQIITAGTMAGKTFAGVSVNDVNSKEKELLEVAGFPVGFAISAENKSIYADSRQTFTVKTSILKDSFGNIVPEGTAVAFECRDANGTMRQLNSYTLGGMAELHVQNPASAGNLTIIGSVYGGGKSNLLTLPFTTAFQNIPVRYSSATQRLTIGALRGQLQQLVPNGTPVQADIDQKYQLKTETVDGFAGFDLSDLPKGQHKATITVFDTSIETTFNIIK